MSGKILSAALFLLVVGFMGCGARDSTLEDQCPGMLTCRCGGDVGLVCGDPSSTCELGCKSSRGNFEA